MTRDITKEEQEKISVESYQKGYQRALEIAQAENDTHYLDGYKSGWNAGIKAAQNERPQWARLFVIVVAGSVIGCGIILALAVGLTNLPTNL